MLIRLILVFIIVSFFNLQSVISQLTTLQFPPGHNKIYVSNISPDVEGSPYLFENWVNGEVVLSNGGVIRDIAMNYSVYRKEMHFQSGKNTYVLGAVDSVKLIKLDKRQFVYLPYIEKKKKVSKDYFEELTNPDEAQLLLHHSSVLLKSNYNAALDVGNKNDRLEYKSAYFLKKNDTVVQIDKDGSNLLSLLDDGSNRIREFVAANNLSFTNQDDLIRIVEYYNSIQKLKRT